jgi:hypothetical protein
MTDESALEAIHAASEELQAARRLVQQKRALMLEALAAGHKAGYKNTQMAQYARDADGKPLSRQRISQFLSELETGESNGGS